LAAAFLGAVAFFLVRPWRFGLLTPQERANLRLTGAVFFFSHVLNSAIFYFKW
jgi:hypothetical protein